jgi:Zn-dependent protease
VTRIATIAGTTIEDERSFLFLLVIIVLNAFDSGGGSALLWVPVAIVSVLAHELSHAAAIALFGFGGSRIVLAGMGGVTINTRLARPWQDLLISLAGPASSLLIAFGIGAAGGRGTFLMMMRDANLVWGIFNLLPVVPLDGGHAVRHLLRLVMNELTAFHISTWLSIITAAVVAIAGARAGWLIAAALMAYYIFLNFQQWQQVRQMQRQAAAGGYNPPQAPGGSSP